MIEFECPECGALNEVSDRKAGRRVRCTDCDLRIDVPEGERRRAMGSTGAPRDRLSQNEYIIYGLIFLVSPFINVIVSSMLYFAWKETMPTKAYQINQLGWAAFGIQCIPICGCCCLGIAMGPPGPGGRRR